MHDAEVLFQFDSDLICVLGGTDGKTAACLPKGLVRKFSVSAGGSKLSGLAMHEAAHFLDLIFT